MDRDRAANKISKILDAIFVFDDDFKERIRQGIVLAEPAARAKLRRVLEAVLAFQKKSLAEKMAADPVFFAKAANAERALASAIVQEYAQSSARLDQGKINQVLTKIKTL